MYACKRRGVARALSHSHTLLRILTHTLSPFRSLAPSSNPSKPPNLSEFYFNSLYHLRCNLSPPLFPEDVELVGAVNDAPSPAPAPSVSAPAASPELPSTEGSLLVFVSDVSGVWACFPLSSFDVFASTSATGASAAVLPVPSISAAAAAAAAFAAAAFSFFLLFLLLPTMALPPTPVTSRAFGVHMTSY